MADRRVTTSNLKIPAPVANWMKATFVEDIHGALKKAEMYAEYESFCKEHRMKPKDPNTFGKYVLRIFPTAYPSRLGSILDGSQAHCYSGLSRIQRRPEPTVAPVPVDLKAPLQPVKVEQPSAFSAAFRFEETSYMECSSVVTDSELEAMVDAMLAEADYTNTQAYFQPQRTAFYPQLFAPQPAAAPVLPSPMLSSQQQQPTFFAPTPVPIIWWESEEPTFSQSAKYSEAFDVKTECDDFDMDLQTNTTPYFGNSYC